MSGTKINFIRSELASTTHPPCHANMHAMPFHGSPNRNSGTTHFLSEVKVASYLMQMLFQLPFSLEPTIRTNFPIS